MLEVLGKEVSGELGCVPNHKAVVPRPPRHDGVRRRIIHHLVRLAKERRRRRPRPQSSVRRCRTCVWRRRRGSCSGPIHSTALLPIPIPIRRPAPLDRALWSLKTRVFEGLKRRYLGFMEREGRRQRSENPVREPHRGK